MTNKIIIELANDLNITNEVLIRACELLNIDITKFKDEYDLLEELEYLQEELLNNEVSIKVDTWNKYDIKCFFNNLDEMDLLDLNFRLKTEEGLITSPTGYSDVFEIEKWNDYYKEYNYLGKIECNCYNLLEIIKSPFYKYNLVLDGCYIINLDLRTWISLIYELKEIDINNKLERYINQLFIDFHGDIGIDYFNEEIAVGKGYYKEFLKIYK